MMQRETVQRRAIREALRLAGRPLSPQELLDEAQKSVPGLGMATVYRTVKGLLDENWLAPVNLPGEPARYEIAGKPHHHHFHCKACSKVYEIAACPGKLDSMLPPGFTLEGHELILYGACPACAADHATPHVDENSRLHGHHALAANGNGNGHGGHHHHHHHVAPRR